VSQFSEDPKGAGKERKGGDFHAKEKGDEKDWQRLGVKKRVRMTMPGIKRNIESQKDAVNRKRSL